MRNYTKSKGLVLGVCFLAYGLSVSAANTITFTWQAANTNEKTFYIQAGGGKDFTVYWGDGTNEEYTGAGNTSLQPGRKYAAAGTYTVKVVTEDTSCRFTYFDCKERSVISLDVSTCTALTTLLCYTNSLISLDVSNCTKLKVLSCNDNLLSSLDVSKNTELNGLACQNNSLTRLDVSNNTDLLQLHCQNNHLPLSDLYAASQTVNNPQKRLGPQRLLPQTIAVNSSIDVSSQAAFGNPDTATVFVIEKGGMPADSGTDYTMVNSVITFLVEDTFTVTMTNEAIISLSGYPATVTAEIVVQQITKIAALSALTVSEGVLMPDFNPAIFTYYVHVANTVSAITLTAAPANHPNATVSGDVGTHTLIVGQNPFTITVTSEDNTATNDYKVFVTRVDDVGIGDVEAENFLPIRVYPNPTTGQLRVAGYGVQADAEIEIYDVVGCNVETYRVRPTEDEAVINISGLANGLYFLKIDNKTVKIIKQ